VLLGSQIYRREYLSYKIAKIEVEHHRVPHQRPSDGRVNLRSVDI